MPAGKSQRNKDLPETKYNVLRNYVYLYLSLSNVLIFGRKTAPCGDKAWERG